MLGADLANNLYSDKDFIRDERSSYWFKGDVWSVMSSSPALETKITVLISSYSNSLWNRSQLMIIYCQYGKSSSRCWLYTLGFPQQILVGYDPIKIKLQIHNKLRCFIYKYTLFSSPRYNVKHRKVYEIRIQPHTSLSERETLHVLWSEFQMLSWKACMTEIMAFVTRDIWDYRKAGQRATKNHR